MLLLAVTHSGKFHADDVLSWSLIQYFCPQTYTLTRSRDENIFLQADMIFDVGGIFDPQQCKFDHHQHDYTGPFSSAGMLLEWLLRSKKISKGLYEHLKVELVDFVDDVDNGRVKPQKGQPDFTTMIDCYNEGCSSLEQYDIAFQKASNMAIDIVESLCLRYQTLQRNIQIVQAEMELATKQNRNFLFFSNYVSWKDAYFSITPNHSSDFVIYPSLQGNWTTVAIPPNLNSFDQKRSLPEHWAGYMGDEIIQITGRQTAIFCHKNRFICAFSNLKDMIEALAEEDMLEHPNIETWLEEIKPKI
jgi:uncharacterized UPF0160 family protein